MPYPSPMHLVVTFSVSATTPHSFPSISPLHLVYNMTCPVSKNHESYAPTHFTRRHTPASSFVNPSLSSSVRRTLCPPGPFPSTSSFAERLPPRLPRFRMDDPPFATVFKEPQTISSSLLSAHSIALARSVLMSSGSATREQERRLMMHGRQGPGRSEKRCSFHVGQHSVSVSKQPSHICH